MKNRIIAITGSLLIIAGVAFSCRQEEKSSLSIEKIQLAESKKEMMVGERATIKLTVTPQSARESNKVEYSVSVPGIISIDNEHSSNEGVVIEATGSGSAVVMARVNGLVDYCSITVEGGNEIAIPYISVTDPVVEVKVGAKRHVVASLQGGIPGDQNNFVFVNSDSSTVVMDYANNTAVIEGVKTGSARITAIHPKAQYSVDVLAFVLNEGETAKYITGENVMFMELGSQPREYKARLVGLRDDEVNYCIYQVIEGADIVTIKGSGDSCTIEAKKKGVAKVRVVNQAVVYPFEFHVVVRDNAETRYISVPGNFFIIEGSDYRSINATMVGDAPDDFVNYYTYSLSANGIVDVVQIMGNFVVNGLKNGMVVLTISNKYSDFDCEILVVAQNQEANAQSHEVYIRTSQQVIQMEAGKSAPDAILKMELVGGTSADQNNFEWVVEDSSIIEVKAPGEVRYTRAQINTQTSFEAEAVITARRAGTTRITVYNSKALNEVTVMVKVYPYGTFNGQAIFISGPGIIRVQEGQSANVYTPVVGGNEKLLGNTVWESADSAIAEVNGSGVYGNVMGIERGVTRLKVSGENIAQDYEAVVVVYREGEEDLIPYAYTDSVYYRITVGQTIKIPVHHPNITDDNFSFSVINSNKNSIYHVVSRDIIMVNGLSEGGGELVITTSDSNCNNLTVYIIVESDQPDAGRPYMLTGNNFAGTDEGGVVSYTVTLAGANVGKLNGIVYSIDDECVARVKGRSGNTVEIEGIAKGQTVLRINHSESMNEKAVVVYVVEKGMTVDGKIVIGIEKTNYVMSVNQSLFLRLLTNASETQKLGFVWKSNYADKVYIEDNYDTAVITALKTGNVRVTVYEKDNKHVIDLDIFITIQDEYVIKGELGFPDSVILIKNQNKIIKGSVIGVTPGSVNDITYTLEDQGVASVTAGQGLEAVLKGLEPGQTFLTVTSFKLDYYRKILVICVENESDLDALYYFTVDKTLYRIKKNDEIKVNLLFGENGFPENERALIEWRNTSNNNAVLIAPQGGGASIIGKNEGQAVIQIKSRLMAKPVEIVIEVSDIVKGSDYYWFAYTSIHQMSKDGVNMIPISIYYGNEYYDEHDVYKPGIKMDQGYSGIMVDIADKDVADAAMAGQSLRVSAKSPGRTEITLSHELIAEDAKLLIVVYEGEVPPSSDELVIFIPKNHWLIPQGQTRTITVQTNTDAFAGNSGIIWNNHNQELFSVDSGGKINALVTAIREGSGIITIEYGGKVIDTVYVSVASNNNVSAVSVATESIIVLSMEDAGLSGYTTRIIVNGGGEYGIMWDIADRSIAEFEDNGTKCTLWPVGGGITELIVRGSGFSKTIIVKVVDTQTEKLSARLMNLDQRYYRIKKGETYVLNPYYKVIKPFYPVSASHVYDNRVIQCRQTSGGIAVTGKNVGIEHIKLFNGECENEVEIVFEVDETIAGGFADVKNMVYMTTDTPAIIIEPGTVNYYVAINVIGEYKGGEDDFIWNSGSDRITANSFGRYALVSAGNQEGDAEITVSNIFCDGLPLKIKVIIGKAVTYENNDLPYIYTAKNVYTMNRGDSGILIPLEIRGVSPVDYNNITVSTSGGAVYCGFSNGNIVVNEISGGISTIRVTYQGIQHTLVLYVIVQERNDSGAAYLTTGQNYVIVNKHNTCIVDISLVNYTELDSSKFSWRSANDSIAHIIGNGRTVQILGMDTGVTKVTVSHPKAYNDLDIVVKIIPAGSSENICYLTTGGNVIETYVSTITGQITVNKVGGTTGTAEATWSVDDPSILSVIGNNNIGYYTAKKAGVAKITVTDREAGNVSIVVIVRKNKPGDGYLMTSENIKQITPGSINNTISVTLFGGEENDEKDFKWEIYTQLPGNIEVARQGGSVISLFAMGSRASVNGIYAGTARVKVTHPKAAEALFILVQVTNFQSMRFTQRNIDLETEEMTYLTLETPDYENYTGKVKYMTDNPSVCTVYGSSKAALLSAHISGKAVITAYVEGTDLIASVNVNVLPEKNYDLPYIVTPKTMYVLSPREKPFLISAQLLGVGVNEQDWDSLVWTVKNNDTNMLKIYPENVVENGGVAANKSIGRTIQVEVMNREYKETESCVIEISCPSQTSRIKTIFLQVQEDTNAFTLNKYDIKMQSNEMMELSCNIIGGSGKDYDEVYWIADADSFDPTKDIVKIMGRGKTVQILAAADGITQVTAVYRGLMKYCTVTVKSSVYFDIQYKNFLTYPGERQNNNNLIEIQYEVRPVTAFIQWIDTDTDFNKKIANISYTQAEDNGTGTGVGKILIDPLQEGAFTIMGISNNKNSRVNIAVKNIYRFMLDRHDIEERPSNWKYNYFGNIKTDADTTVNYIVSPANVQIVVKSHTEEQLFNLGIRLVISWPRRNGEALRGTGTILAICEKETLEPVSIVLEILQTDGKPAGKEQILNINIRYPQGQGRLVPVFEPVYGVYSNQYGASYKNTILNQPKGQLYNSGRYLSGFESRNNAGIYTDTYTLEIGDGEEHYILLDRVNSNANIANIVMTNLSSNEYLGGAGRAVTAQQVIRDNGEAAIRIRGGNDYVVYSHFGSDYDLNVKLSSDRPNSGGIGKCLVKAGEGVHYPSSLIDSGDYDIITYTDHGYETQPPKFRPVFLDGENLYHYNDYCDRETFKNYYYVPKEYYLADGTSTTKSLTFFAGTGQGGYYTKTYGQFFTYPVDYYEYSYDYGTATDTYYDPIKDTYAGGNIRLSFSLMTGTNTDQNAKKAYMYVEPKDANTDKYWKPYPAYQTYSSFCSMVSFMDDSRDIIERNFITGFTHYWNKNVIPANATNTKKTEPFNGYIRCLDWIPSYTGMTNPYVPTDQNKVAYIQIDKGFYKPNSSGWSRNQEILYEPPFGCDLQWNNGDKVRMSMIDIFKERYDPNNDSVLYDKYSDISKDDKNPYRFYPMPSIQTEVIQRRNAGAITIRYANSYGAANSVNITVTHVIRQCHANYNVIEGRQYRLAETWDETVPVEQNNIFKEGNAFVNINEPDNSRDLTGKIRIPKDY